MTIHYKNLVLEGCGMAGLAYIGSLKILEERNIIKNIDTFIGTSSGAIMASFISIGYSSKEIYDLTKNIDWKNMVKKRTFCCFHFFKNYGLFNYDNMENTIKKFFYLKLGKSDMTFKEHYNLTKKKLVLVSVNLNKRCSEYFSKDTHPDMSVIKAIKMSTSFPFIFDPVIHDNDHYVDGGLMNNFPIEYFKNNKETLGINVVDENFDHVNPFKHRIPINNIFNYGFNILSSIMLIQDNDDLEYSNNNIIYIKTNVENIFDNIILMNQNLDKLYNIGMKYTIEFFNKNDSLNSQHVDD